MSNVEFKRDLFIVETASYKHYIYYKDITHIEAPNAKYSWIHSSTRGETIRIDKCHVKELEKRICGEHTDELSI